MGSSQPKGTEDSEEDEFHVEGYLTLRKFSHLVELSYQAALNLVRKKAVLAVRVGGQYRIYESEVRRFLREGNHPDCSLPSHKNRPKSW
jgi:excisionase family DNA binding protein